MRGRPIKALIAAIAVIAAVVVVPTIVPSLSDLNPFTTETKDRSQPSLLRSLESLAEYRAATGNYQQLVDIERDVGLLPSFLAGERALLIAAGSVDAVVDFSGLDARSVQVSEDRRAVTVTLPAPHLSEARVDLKRSRALDTKRGLINRVGDLFDDDKDEQRELLLVAERRIARAAQENPRLLTLGERNTRTMLTGMLKALGFEEITIRFARPPAET
ncbi:MAG TPA: DUF4230 domain-containing protein [Solirubrobacteraceae bacterium]|nr:DUF4230 domain-containing protein [Solirubrobacteraceae bacterium]